LGVDRPEPERALVEISELVLVGHQLELALGREGPAMESAAEALPAAGAAADELVAAMRARIVERADLAVLAAHDQERRLEDGQLADEVAAGLGQVPGVADRQRRASDGRRTTRLNSSHDQ